jgi:hypothetical protein
VESAKIPSKFKLLGDGNIGKVLVPEYDHLPPRHQDGELIPLLGVEARQLNSLEFGPDARSQFDVSGRVGQKLAQGIVQRVGDSGSRVDMLEWLERGQLEVRVAPWKKVVILVTVLACNRLTRRPRRRRASGVRLPGGESETACTLRERLGRCYRHCIRWNGCGNKRCQAIRRPIYHDTVISPRRSQDAKAMSCSPRHRHAEKQLYFFLHLIYSGQV